MVRADGKGGGVWTLLYNIGEGVRRMLYLVIWGRGVDEKSHFLALYNTWTAPYLRNHTMSIRSSRSLSLMIDIDLIVKLNLK